MIDSSHSITSNEQTAIEPPDSLSITQADLDRGLSPDQLRWFYANWNVRTFLKDLAKLAPVDDGQAEPEGGADATPG